MQLKISYLKKDTTHSLEPDLYTELFRNMLKIRWQKKS